MTTPDPAAIARFRGDLAGLPGSDGRLLLAVSGGADSLAMLLIGHAAMADRIICATVDHGLRADAAAEAAMVARVCADRGVAHAVLNVALSPGGNVQARARAARYDVLAGHAARSGCAAILTAHHADDQAETLLMRASRGSGIDGLAGVRAAGMWGTMPMLRPLLGWRKADLSAIVAGVGLIPADDPTNHDPAHDRSRVRQLIATSGDLDPVRLARSAGALADAAEAIGWSTAQLVDARIARIDDVRTVDPAGLPREYRRRLLVHALAQLGVADPRGPSLDRLLGALDRDGAGMLGDVQATVSGGLWHLRPAPPRRSH